MKKRKIFNAVDRPAVWKPILAGKKVGLVTNPSGVDRELRLTSDILYESGNLTCMFSPEHGVRGDKQAGDQIGTYIDEKTGLPVYSLYGSGCRHIKPEIMEEIDAIVFDIQDVGARFYTYIYTLSFVMEDCVTYGKEMIVFDRLNPLGGVRPEGTVLEPEFASTIGRFPIATRFNMTVGEYAKFINETQNINCPLTVVPIDGWSRDCIFSDTDLSWVSPSPNLPTTSANFCYIGTCLAEGTNLSEGRGTTRPFETVGAPWIDADEVVAYMKSLSLPGVKFRPCHFTPTFSKHAGELCHGIQLHVTDYREFMPFETGLYLISHIRETYPDFAIRGASKTGKYFIDLLMGCDDFRKDDFSIEAFLKRQKEKLTEYESLIKKFYLYS